jgi:thiamine pyrophosphokinase
LDHSAASLLLLASPEWQGLRMRLIDGRQSAEVLQGGRSLQLIGQPGDTVSLLPLSGDTEGITTSGLEYPLSDENLRFGSTRGVSNTLLSSQAEVYLGQGLLLVVVIHGPADYGLAP